MKIVFTQMIKRVYPNISFILSFFLTYRTLKSEYPANSVYYLDEYYDVIYKIIRTEYDVIIKRYKKYTVAKG